MDVTFVEDLTADYFPEAIDVLIQCAVLSAGGIQLADSIFL